MAGSRFWSAGPDDFGSGAENFILGLAAPAQVGYIALTQKEAGVAQG